MKNFRQTISALLVLVTVSLVNGWHLPVLQSIAWMNMFQEYNEVMPATKAFSFTFSGEELCDLCQFVKSENNNTQEHWNQWNSSRIQLMISYQDLGEVPVSTNKGNGNTDYLFVWLEYSCPPQAPPPKLLV